MKKIFAFVLALVMVCMFSACNITPTVVYDSHNDNEVTIVFADLAEVPGYKHLYYSVNTHTVYYLYGITSTVGSTFTEMFPLAEGRILVATFASKICTIKYVYIITPFYNIVNI